MNSDLTPLVTKMTKITMDDGQDWHFLIVKYGGDTLIEYHENGKMIDLFRFPNSLAHEIAKAIVELNEDEENNEE